MLKCRNDLFEIPDHVSYLNCAYMSPLMKKVMETGIRGIYLKSKPFQIKPNDFFEETKELRKIFAQLINLSRSERIVVIPSVSYGIGNVVKNIKLSRGDKILMTSEQFPSNVYPWFRLAKDTGAEIISIEPPEGMARGTQWNERILDSIKPGVKVVTMGSVHWSDGTTFDLKQIGARARDVGALFILDGTQSIGAMPFNLNEIKPDALICAGYKWLLSPYSISLGYYGEYFDDGIPIEESWMNRIKSEDFAGLVNYQMEYQPGSLRYEVGEHSNFVLVPMMMEALKQIIEWTPEAIQKYCKEIIGNTVDELKDEGFLIEDENCRGSHLFGIRMPGGVDRKKLKDRLEKNHIFVSIRGSAIRVSPHIYNNKNDLVKLRDTILNR